MMAFSMVPVRAVRNLHHNLNRLDIDCGAVPGTISLFANIQAHPSTGFAASIRPCIEAKYAKPAKSPVVRVPGMGMRQCSS
jgi:hypothetical protein